MEDNSEEHLFQLLFPGAHYNLSTASSFGRSHSRRVNPRFCVFRSVDSETAYYGDEEIPVVKPGDSNQRLTRSKTAWFDNSVDNFLKPSTIPIVTVEDESQEDDYILLTAYQPRIKVALLQTQDLFRNAGFQNRKRPMLSHELKFFSRKGAIIPESPVETDSPDDPGVPTFSFTSPSFNDADDSSYDNDKSFDASERLSVKSVECRRQLIFSETPSTRRSTFASKKSTTLAVSPSFTCDNSLRRKSVYVRETLSMSAKVPRKLSRMFSGFGDDTLSRKMRLTVPQMGCEEFNRITRKYSRELVKNVLFVPRGAIRIVRLSNERFFDVDNIAELLRTSLSYAQKK
ncbi:unnamed protein product [Strongylus vulgaris]|uniref:Uncharacterized protein n=1 Tax=Strongylus vulgaris TaxID=40348 RepID=A0A3P7JE15_STRVU|nr:unnamed protein product [Strongylus vulgaris]